jgi:hypothetical protein
VTAYRFDVVQSATTIKAIRENSRTVDARCGAFMAILLQKAGVAEPILVLGVSGEKAVRAGDWRLGRKRLCSMGTYKT